MWERAEVCEPVQKTLLWFLHPLFKSSHGYVKPIKSWIKFGPQAPQLAPSTSNWVTMRSNLGSMRYFKESTWTCGSPSSCGSLVGVVLGKVWDREVQPGRLLLLALPPAWVEMEGERPLGVISRILLASLANGKVHTFTLFPVFILLFHCLHVKYAMPAAICCSMCILPKMMQFVPDLHTSSCNCFHCQSSANGGKSDICLFVWFTSASGTLIFTLSNLSASTISSKTARNARAWLASWNLYMPSQLLTATHAGEAWKSNWLHQSTSLMLIPKPAVISFLPVPSISLLHLI